MHLRVAADQQHHGNACDQHAPCGRVTRALEIGCERQGGYQRDVEQNGSAGGGRETIVGIEDACEQRLQRHKRQVRKCDARERDSEVEALGIVGQARRQQHHHVRCEQERDRQQDEVDGDERGADLIGEEFRRRQPRLLQRMGIGRHEGCRERAFGEDRAEMVRQPEGDEEGIGDGPGAENGGHHHIANETREARYERQPADGGNAPDHGCVPFAR